MPAAARLLAHPNSGAISPRALPLQTTIASHLRRARPGWRCHLAPRGLRQTGTAARSSRPRQIRPAAGALGHASAIRQSSASGSERRRCRAPTDDRDHAIPDLGEPLPCPDRSSAPTRDDRSWAALRRTPPRRAQTPDHRCPSAGTPTDRCPRRQWNSLPPAIVDRLEQRIETRGAYEVYAVKLAEDDVDSIQCFFESTDGRRYRVYPSGNQWKQASAAQVRVKGIAIDDAMALEQLDPIEPAAAAAPLAAPPMAKSLGATSSAPLYRCPLAALPARHLSRRPSRAAERASGRRK